MRCPGSPTADTPRIPRDRGVRPSLDEVLTLLRDRMTTVRAGIAALTDESLATHAESRGPVGHGRRASRCGSVC